MFPRKDSKTLLHIPCHEKSTCSGSHQVFHRWQKLWNPILCSFLSRHKAALAGVLPQSSQKGTVKSAGCTWLKQWCRRRKASSVCVLHHQACLRGTSFCCVVKDKTWIWAKKCKRPWYYEECRYAAWQTKKNKQKTTSYSPCLEGEGCCLGFFALEFVDFLVWKIVKSICKMSFHF